MLLLMCLMSDDFMTRRRATLLSLSDSESGGVRLARATRRQRDYTVLVYWCTGVLVYCSTPAAWKSANISAPARSFCIDRNRLRNGPSGPSGTSVWTRLNAKLLPIFKILHRLRRPARLRRQLAVTLVLIVHPTIESLAQPGEGAVVEHAQACAHWHRLALVLYFHQDL